MIINLIKINMNLSQISILFTWTAVSIFYVVCWVRNKENQEPIYVGKSKWALFGIIFFFTLLYSTLWIKELSLENALPIEWALSFILAGYILLLSGFALTIWSLWSLGKILEPSTSVTSNYPLLENGPFAFIRYPVHSGRLLIWLGSTLIFLNPVGIFFGLTILIPIINRRVRNDEKNLSNIHGPLFEDYRNRTGKFFPKIR